MDLRTDNDPYYNITTSTRTLNYFQTKFSFVEVVKDATDSGIHIDSLRQIFLDVNNGTMSSSNLNNILFESQSDAKTYYFPLNNSVSSISASINQDSIVSNEVSNFSNTNNLTEGINYFFDNFNNIYNNKGSFLNAIDGTNPPGQIPCVSCENIVKLTVCSYICSVSTGGWGTGWMCW